MARVVINANCIHLDNWGYCKIQKAPFLLRWATPRGRMACADMVRASQFPQDDEDNPLCKLREEHKRPAPPAPIPPRK